jgi:hypothetical protein
VAANQLIRLQMKIPSIKRNWKLSLITILFVWSQNSISAQTNIRGSVKDPKGNPVSFCNVYLENTLDGTTTDTLGKFSFKTTERGEKVLLVSGIGYETAKQPVTLDQKIITLDIDLKSTAVNLEVVVVTAGSFEANNDREVAILKPLDIYNNAGAGGDIVGAIRSLPGTQQAGDQTGLFVRGGDASESTVIIDGMVVQNPFYSSAPGVSARSRFMPFQFKGMAFSSGGYSARYGQALSSILELNTTDLPEKSTVNLNLNMAGAGVGISKLWKNSAGEITAGYNNLSPYLNIANTNYDYYKVPQGGSFSGKWATMMKNGGLIKSFLKQDFTNNGIYVPDPFHPGETVPYGIINSNTYFNTSYRLTKEKSYFYSGISISTNTNDLTINDTSAKNNDWRIQWRGESWYLLTNSLSLLTGLEIQKYMYVRKFDTLNSSFEETLPAIYLEAQWTPIYWFSIKPGIRYEYSKITEKSSISPRLALAVKTSKYGQVSVASGFFYQDAENNYLFQGYRPKFQQTVHYIANYQWIKNDRSLRIEGYYKSYDQLVREMDTSKYDPNPYRYIFGPVDNSGNGYAKGIDFFWRDKASIKNFDYWISYSYIDTKRLYQNYIEKATPDFVAKHNLNVLLKYFIDPLHLAVGLSYAYSSGRPYYDPHSDSFLGETAPDYHNLAFNLAYLVTIKKVFAVVYAGIDNLTNHKNIYGYRYDTLGNKYPIEPPIYRSIFVGVNISLTAFSKDELLN